MGRERYRRLPRTIVFTFVVFFVLYGLFTNAWWLKRQQTQYRKTAEAHSLSRMQAEEEEQVCAARARALGERVDEMRGWATDAEAIGESAGAAAWREKAIIKKREAESESARAAAWAKLQTFYASLEQKYQWAAAHPWKSLEPDPLPPQP
jgi:hypothetical protein